MLQTITILLLLLLVIGVAAFSWALGRGQTEDVPRYNYEWWYNPMRSPWWYGRGGPPIVVGGGGGRWHGGGGGRGWHHGGGRGGGGWGGRGGKRGRDEGFISFGVDVAMHGKVVVPLYSTTKEIMKLSDNLFFDPTNGNVIEVQGPAYHQASSSSSAGFETGTSSGATTTTTTPATSTGGGATAGTTTTTPATTTATGAGTSTSSTGATTPATATGAGAAGTSSGTTGSTTTTPATAATGTNTAATTPPSSSGGSNTTPPSTSSSGSAVVVASTAPPIASSSSASSSSIGQITHIVVITRTNNQRSYMQPTGDNAVTSCPESMTTSVDVSGQWFSYNTTGNTTDKYMVCYAAWNRDTYIHIINRTTNSTVSSHYFTPSLTDSSVLQFTNATIRFPSATSNTNLLSVSGGGADSATMRTSVTGYPNQVYVLSDTGYFDLANGYLVLANPGARNVTKYDRYGSIVASSTVAASVPPATTLAVWTVVHGFNLYVYIAYGFNTVILLISNTGSITSPRYTLVNVRKYNRTGVEADNTGTALNGEIVVRPDDRNDSPAVSGSGGGVPSGAQSDLFAAMFAAWLRQNPGAVGTTGTTPAQTTTPQQPPTTGSAVTTTGSTVNLDDYILKTQLLAPVYPVSCLCGGRGGGCDKCGGGPKKSKRGEEDEPRKTTAATASPPATRTDTTASSWLASLWAKEDGDAAAATAGETGTTPQAGGGTGGPTTTGNIVGISDDLETRRGGVAGVDPRSAFGAMIPKGKTYRPMSASVSF